MHFVRHNVHFGRHLQIQRDLGALFIRVLLGIGWDFLSKNYCVNGYKIRAVIFQFYYQRLQRRCAGKSLTFSERKKVDHFYFLNIANWVINLNFLIFAKDGYSHRQNLLVFLEYLRHIEFSPFVSRLSPSIFFWTFNSHFLK